MNGTTLMIPSKLVSMASGFQYYPSSKVVKKPSMKKFCPSSSMGLHARRRMGATPREKHEVFKSMEKWVGDNILTLMKPVEKSWQPQDYLPDPSIDDFEEQVREVRERTRGIPDECLVVLVGDMITEEALPTYQSNLSMGISDCVECDDNTSSPWHIWTRAWSAEENRHGDLLNKYLFLSGRVDMKQIEKTIQYLISSGMKVGTRNNLYLGFIYTSFQERATFISHANTAKLATLHGDLKLAQICGTIAADEKRHEAAYTKIVDKLFQLDPDETVQSLAYIMRRGITMPAHLMFDGRDANLFANYSAVASRLGVYTVMDYITILEHLVDKWKVPKLSGLSPEGREAQDYVCGLASRLRRLEDRTHVKAYQAPTVSFSWIFGRDA